MKNQIAANKCCEAKNGCADTSPVVQSPTVIIKLEILEGKISSLRDCFLKLCESCEHFLLPGAPMDQAKPREEVGESFVVNKIVCCNDKLDNLLNEMDSVIGRIQ